MIVLRNWTASLFFPSHINDLLPSALGPVSEFSSIVPTTFPLLINSAVILIISVGLDVIILNLEFIIFSASFFWALKLYFDGNNEGFGK